MVQLLIGEGADLNARDYLGNTALIYAAQLGYEEIVKDLIGKGADVNASNREECTALTYAVLLGREEISTALLNNRADRSQTDKRLEDSITRRQLTSTLQSDCHYSVYGLGDPPLYYETSLCAACGCKRSCDGYMARVRATTP